MFDGCPHADAAIRAGHSGRERLGPGITVERVDVDTPERAAELGFPGSPSIRVNGADIEGKTASAGRLCCRTYEGGAGFRPSGSSRLPCCGRWRRAACCSCAWRTRPAASWQRASPDRWRRPASRSGPRGRSRRASGRKRSPRSPRSASTSRTTGPSPCPRFRPARSTRSITLCGEEECPVFLGKARRLHWGLPDPAGVGGSDADRADAFRRTRDELRRRLGVVFDQDAPSGTPSQG